SGFGFNASVSPSCCGGGEKISTRYTLYSGSASVDRAAPNAMAAMMAACRIIAPTTANGGGPPRDPARGKDHALSAALTSALLHFGLYDEADGSHIELVHQTNDFHHLAVGHILIGLQIRILFRLLFHVRGKNALEL